MGVSKPPCCMCSSVLGEAVEDSEYWRYKGQSEVTPQEIKAFYERVHSEVFVGRNSPPVESGPQTIDVDGTGKDDLIA